MFQFRRILFVGKDNTCRSMMAQGIMRTIVENQEIEIVSRGTIVMFPEPFNQKMDLVLHSHGIMHSEDRTTALTKDDLSEETLVLTVSFQDKLKVIEDYQYDCHVYTIMVFIGEEEELPDPYGEDVCEYELCYQELLKVLQQVAHKLGLLMEG